MAYRRSLDHQARGRGRAGGQDAHSGARHRCEPSFSPRFSLVALLAIIASIMLVGFIFSGNACSSDDMSSAGGGAAEGQSASELDVADSQAPEEARTVKVTFAGDCTLGTDESFDYSTSFNATFESKGDPSWFLANVEPIFADDDLTIVNMEGTLTEATARQDKTFAFKGDADYAKVFSTSSVEAASVANNHSYDYGQQSYDDTLVALEAEGVQPFGYSTIAYKDVNGVKVAMIGTNALADYDGTDQGMIDHIGEARQAGAELVLVYVHWGVERDYVPRDNERSIAHAAIDAGADLVVGGHPHVIQGWEVYQGRYIVYSLGNFCFGGNSNPSDKDCMVFQQTFTLNGDEVERNDDVEFIACSISSASSYNNYQPTPAEGSEKERIDAKIQESTDAIAAM